MKFNTKQICIISVFLALTFIITRFIQIPIPLGYVNVGNCIILSSCILTPFPAGIIIGSLGSTLADLSSFPVYALPTLFIKALMPLLFNLLYKPGKHKFGRAILASIIALLIPVVGYTLSGCFIYNSFATGLVQLPGLLVEYAVNLVMFIVLLKPVLNIHKRLN